MPVALRPVVALLAACAAVAGCDSEPGFADLVRPPSLADVSVTPASARLDGAAPTATVPLAVTGTLDAEGPVGVRVLVRWAETDSLVAQADERVAEPGPFRIEVPLVVPRGAVGDYSVRVATEGADRRPGDGAAAVFRFAATNLGPPAVTVQAAAPVDRPTGSQPRTVPVLADVTDPDGRANIAAVVLRVPDGGGVVGRLFDGGPPGADRVAGDGRYSAGILVGSDFEPGTYDLEVVAVDRAGAESAPAPFSFTVR